MTQTILRIDASARTEGSASRAFADTVLGQLPAAEVVTRDANPLPHITADYTAGTFIPPEARSAAQREALVLSDELFAEIKAADTLLITTATYNFNIPSPLKAWIDQVARAGLAFRYTETGPQGLLTGKRAVVLRASGSTPTGAAHDFITPYLTFVFGFIGITDVTFLDAPAKPTEAEVEAAREALAPARASA